MPLSAAHVWAASLRSRGARALLLAVAGLEAAARASRRRSVRSSAFSWQAGLIAVGGWIAGALITQYSSVGSMFGSVIAPVALWFFTGSLAETLYGVAAALLIVFMHRENIGRLRAGTEGAIGFKCGRK